MKARHICLGLLVSAVFASAAAAQHCPPIYETYLSEVSLKHVEGGSLRFQIEYTKHGGQYKDAYQGYLLAYLDRDADMVPPKPPEDTSDESYDDMIDERVVILKTALMKRSEDDRRFDFEFEIDCDELAEKMIEHGKLTEEDRLSNGGWGMYNFQIRIAFFVPFLENEKYSNVDGLPEKKHECNYLNRRALIFQELPYELGIHFGIVQAYRLEEGQHHIQINQLTATKEE